MNLGYDMAYACWMIQSNRDFVYDDCTLFNIWRVMQESAEG
jgi:hypothetical protein